MTFPEAIRHYLADRLLTPDAAAFVVLSEEGRVLEAGGETRLFGPAELAPGTVLSEIAPFTSGLGESRAPLVMPRILTHPNIWVDVHLVSSAPGALLLLLDVSEAVRRETELLQQANELALIKRSPALPDAEFRTLFSALNLLAARLVEGDRLVPLGDLPAWGGRFVPLLDDPTADWEEDRSLAFLGAFMHDANEFWALGEPGNIRSGVWVDDDLDGTEFLYEATAACTSTQRVLLLSRIDSASAEKQAIIQTGRELALSHRDLARDRSQLERDNNRLEKRVRGRTEDLEQINQRLEAALKRRAELEDERATIIDRAQQSQRIEALGTLAGGIAHDFNNVLAAVLGFAELGLLPETSHEAKQGYFQSIEEAAIRAQDLVRQILVMTRRTQTDARIIQVGDIVDEVERLMRATLASNIDIDAELITNPAVSAAPTEMHQILMNLCTNAGYAMRSNGGSLRLTVDELEVTDRMVDQFPDLSPGQYAVIEVRDTGEGMSTDTLPRIFTPFFTTKGAGEGTGIGLSVVQGIVTNAGGAVLAWSDPGEGSVFKVFWPVAEASPAGTSGDADRPIVGSERILFVDDEPMQAEIARQMLGKLGYQVTALTSSKEALVRFADSPMDYDLVITDLAMPELSGEVLVREILAARADLPVIVLSGDLAANAQSVLEDVGAERCLLKPVRWREIAETIRELLDVQPTD